MSSDHNSVKLKIYDQEFRVACPDDAENRLTDAAQMVGDMMQKAKKAGVFGVERIAMMAALNIANELLDEQSKKIDSQSVDRMLAQIDDRLS
ncbi:MAG: cell division protein ZapA [Saccharospirillaceae bacterium]|nr:cell division protein ZapA [Pseudomonadales bacterium]NRB81715.1 cell division protein ZapA [Saccharospirillaceae bacterium]